MLGLPVSSQFLFLNKKGSHPLSIFFSLSLAPLFPLSFFLYISFCLSLSLPLFCFFIFLFHFSSFCFALCFIGGRMWRYNITAFWIAVYCRCRTPVHRRIYIIVRTQMCSAPFFSSFFLSLSLSPLLSSPPSLSLLSLSLFLFPFSLSTSISLILFLTFVS